MYWESATKWTLWQGPRLVGAISHLGDECPPSYRARYIPMGLQLSPETRDHNTLHEAKAWLEARLRAEVT